MGAEQRLKDIEEFLRSRGHDDAAMGDAHSQQHLAEAAEDATFTIHNGADARTVLRRIAEQYTTIMLDGNAPAGVKSVAMLHFGLELAVHYPEWAATIAKLLDGTLRDQLGSEFDALRNVVSDSYKGIVEMFPIELVTEVQ